MPKLKSLLTLISFMLLIGGLTAQDIHFTQYNMSPHTLNPGLTGAFEGTFRVGGIYRDQWSSVINNQYRTPALYVDAPIVRGFGKNDWVGIGAGIVYDQAGVVAITTTDILGGISYHLALGPQAKTYLSIGVQGGVRQRRIDKSNALFEDEITSGSGQSIDLDNIGENATSPDLNVGLVLNSTLNSRMNFNLGFSSVHLLEPDYSLLAVGAGTITDDGKLPRRYIGHGQFNADLTDKWTLSPTFLYQRMAGADEIAIQTMAGYHVTPEKDLTLRFGAGYRLSDAASALLGVDYKGLRVGVAYDFNISDLQVASNNRGGFEIAASYIAKIYKNPVVEPVIFCPRF